VAGCYNENYCTIVYYKSCAWGCYCCAYYVALELCHFYFFGDNYFDIYKESLDELDLNL